MIVFGLFMAGALKLAWLQRDLRFHIDIKGGRPLGAYFIGVAFAFGWAPCIGPVLGAILTVSAVAATVSRRHRAARRLLAGPGAAFPRNRDIHHRLLAWLKSVRRIGRWLQVGAGRRWFSWAWP